MNGLECRDAFLHLETKARDIIDDFRFEGVPLWQYLRIAYFEKFYRGEDAAASPAHDIPVVQTYSLETFPAAYRALAVLPKNAAAIWTKTELHNQSSQGMAYDPYLDPVYEECENLGLSPVKLKSGGNEVANPLHPLLDLPLFLKQAVPRDIGPVISDRRYRQYARLSRTAGVPRVLAHEFMGLYFTVESYREIFERMLDILRPKAVFLECYYNAMHMAVAHACRNLGVPCVEYQHGLQNWPHLSYNFPALPENGWETVPEWFFTWGERPARHLGKRFAAQRFHKVAEAGNPGYLAWKSGSVKSGGDLLARFDALVEGRVPVCVALPLFEAEDKIPLLRELIVNSPPEWVWLLRGHPIHKSPEIAMLSDLAGKVESELATRLNVHDVLARSRHVLTAHSTTAYEAVCLHGMRATTITESGRRLFSQDIFDKNMEFADNLEEALASVKKGVEGFPWKPRNPYITDDAGAMAKAIRKAAG